MAQGQIGNTANVTACSAGGGGARSNQHGTTTDPQTGLDMDNTDNIAAMRARLTAINGALYTASYLNVMTRNDMMYAIRLNDFANTIKQ